MDVIGDPAARMGAAHLRDLADGCRTEPRRVAVGLFLGWLGRRDVIRVASATCRARPKRELREVEAQRRLERTARR